MRNIADGLVCHLPRFVSAVSDLGDLRCIMRRGEALAKWVESFADMRDV